ncbi:B-cell receptor CD22 [Triplophysa dalaica]|uniref:B-cell receptor CD22 n=1 Tax=Triplophysa dalaica TaxID=1582913 RepID=UPI0024DF96B9|nr:B-cell receptor CD22 [Triplophysa dalaica]
MLNKLYRQMMFPESTAFFLIVLVFSSSTGSTEELIKIRETEETKAEGSCVTIPCTYKHGNAKNIKLLWYKDPEYDKELKLFTGTILYSNTVDHPQSPGYSSRVEYITGKAEKDKDRSKCDLKINDLQKTDSGIYTFRFIYSDNSKYMIKALNLTVTDNPCKLNIEPSEMKNSVKENDEFSVHCSTSDSCPSYPEWFLLKPGQEPERVTSARYKITQEKNEGKKNTKLKFNASWQDDNMMLSCRSAETQDSCLFRNITLSVEYEPKTAEATVSHVNIKEGDSVTLSCTSRGRPNVNMSWFKNRTKQTQQAVWILYDVKPENSGEYFCEAENKHGKVKSNRISINVKYGPKDVRVTPAVSISNLKEGDELKLNCSVGGSNPTVHQFNWYLNDSLLHQQTSQLLFISEITPENKGSYHCKANNGIKTAQSNRLQIYVKYSPHQIKIDGGTSVKNGSKVTFICSADANPPPNSYSWKHTSTPESLPLSFSNTTGVLTIDTVTIQHAGTYTCAVTNDIGTSETSINVAVLYAPSKPMLTMKSEGEYGVVSIICTVESSPASNLIVTGPSDFKSMPENKNNISKSDNKVTIYLNVSESDAGVYKCTADNSEGTNHIEEELLYAPKNARVRSEGEQITGHKLTLACNTQSKPPSSYEWKKITNGPLGTEGKSQILHLHSLQTSDSGEYVCIVKNIVGKAESQPIDVKVKLDSLSVFYRAIFPIILLLILIALAIFFLRRKFIKARIHQQIRESQNNSRENLAMAEAADPSRGRTDDFYTTLHSPGPARAQVSSARPVSNTQQVYSEITLPQMKQEREDNGSINYVTLDFKRQQELAKRASDDSSSAIYSRVFKKKKSQNTSESEINDYENVSSACARKLPLTYTGWESDTSEEDEVKYTTVTSAVKPGVKEPRKKSSSCSSTSSEEERTVYSDIKT